MFLEPNFRLNKKTRNTDLFAASKLGYKISETFNKTIEFISNFDPKRLEERLDYFGADRTKRQILILLADHITHHRGQMLVYMRRNGLKPPRYVLCQ